MFDLYTKKLVRAQKTGMMVANHGGFMDRIQWSFANFALRRVFC